MLSTISGKLKLSITDVEVEAVDGVNSVPNSIWVVGVKLLGFFGKVGAVELTTDEVTSTASAVLINKALLDWLLSFKCPKCDGYDIGHLKELLLRSGMFTLAKTEKAWEFALAFGEALEESSPCPSLLAFSVFCWCKVTIGVDTANEETDAIAEVHVGVVNDICRNPVDCDEKLLWLVDILLQL